MHVSVPRRPSWLFTLRVLGGLVVMGAACACNGMSDERATLIAEQVVKELQQGEANYGGDLSGIIRQQAPLADIELYVDRSLSMKPYVSSKATTYTDLLDTVGDFIASQVRIYGFGYRNKGEPIQTIEPITPGQLKQPATYSYANNDYASLIQRFRHDGVTRMIVTDGVQSDPKDGPRLGDVAEALYQWMHQGGSFAIFLYRTPYRGQYYSDLAGPDPYYQCDNRPLLLFVLAPSPQAIEDLRARLGARLVPEHIIRISGKDLDLAPVATLPPEGRQNKGTRVMRKIHTRLLKNYHPIYRVIVLDQAGDDRKRYVPLQFAVRLSMQSDPWKILGPEQTRQFIADLHAHLQIWAIDTRARGQQDSLDGEPMLHRQEIDLLEPPEPQIIVTPDSLVARFTLPLRKPAARQRQGKDYVFYLALAPSDENAKLLVPEAYSTTNDLAATNCDKVLKLRRLIGAIILRNYVPGQMLVLADWR